MAEAQLIQGGEQPLVAKAATGQDRHPATRRHGFGQAAEAGVRVVVAPGCDLLPPDGQPDQRGRPAVTRPQAQHQRRWAATVEVGPVHRHQDVLLGGKLLRHPAGETVPHVDACVAHQPVDLLDRVLRHQPTRRRLADHRRRQRRSRHPTQRRIGQRLNPLGVRVRPIQPATEATALSQTPTRTLCPGHAPRPSLDDAQILRSGTKSGLSLHQQT